MKLKPIEDLEFEYVEEWYINGLGENVIWIYKSSRKLGKGGFASVYEMTCLETKEIFAFKIVEKLWLETQW